MGKLQMKVKRSVNIAMYKNRNETDTWTQRKLNDLELQVTLSQLSITLFFFYFFSKIINVTKCKWANKLHKL